MIYTETDLQPIKDYLESQDHGIKKKLAAYLNISPQQLSFYFRYKDMPPSKFKLMQTFIKTIKKVK